MTISRTFVTTHKRRFMYAGSGAGRKRRFLHSVHEACALSVRPRDRRHSQPSVLTSRPRVTEGGGGGNSSTNRSRRRASFTTRSHYRLTSLPLMSTAEILGGHRSRLHDVAPDTH